VSLGEFIKLKLMDVPPNGCFLADLIKVSVLPFVRISEVMSSRVPLTATPTSFASFLRSFHASSESSDSDTGATAEDMVKFLVWRGDS